MSANTNSAARFPDDARAAAEEYIRRGLAPIPLPARSKGEGLAGNWNRLRLTPETLDAHFPKGVALNVGILNGEPSGGLLDLDLDCIEAVRAAPSILPPTSAAFGRPGKPISHRLYRVTPALAAASEEYAFDGAGMLLEMRGTGGMTVFPPSTHRESGEAIGWHTWGDPATLPLDQLRQATRELAAASLIALHWPTKGTRNKAALALCGGLARAGWDEERIGRFAYAVAVAARDEQAQDRASAARGSAAKVRDDRKATGWPKLAQILGQRGEAVIRQAREWLRMAPSEAATPRRTRPAPPYTPFPVGALPPVLGDFVHAVAETVVVDPAFGVVPALAVCAGAIGNSRAVQLKKGWSEPACLWTGTVARSGGGKSPAFGLAIAPLAELQFDRMDAHREAMLAFNNEVMGAKKKADGEDGKEGKEDKKRQPPKPPPRLMTSDTTIEALGENLRDAPKGLLMATDELDNWFGSMVRYKSQKSGTDRGKYLELHRAGNLMLDRMGRERGSLFVRRALVSVTGTIQPRILARALDTESREAGLGARLLVAMPPLGLRAWSDAEMPDDVAAAYAALVSALVGLAPKDAEKRTPHFLGLSAGAKRLFREFVNDLGREAFRADEDRAAVLAKIEGGAARLALVHHVVTHAAAGSEGLCPISEESMAAGITLARWFAGEWVRVQAVLTESEEASELRLLTDIIRENGGRMTARQLQKRKKRTYVTAEEAKAALGRLVEAGWARWIEDGTGRKGGLETKAVELIDDGDTGDSGDTDDDEEDGFGDSGGDTASGTAGAPGTDPTGNPMGEQDLCSDEACPAWSGVPGVPSVPAAGASPAPAGGGRGGVPEPSFRLVDDKAGLEAVALAIGDSPIVAVDTETTGLDSMADRVRLLSLACSTVDGGTFTYLVDCFAVDPSPLWEALDGMTLILHNALFDLRFLARLGFTPSGRVRDTMLLAQLLASGTFDKCGLGPCCERFLSVALDKGLQRSGWAGPLTEAQLGYAAKDAAVLLPLLEKLDAAIEGAGLAEAARIEERAFPTVLWMATNGAAIDRERWRCLARVAGEQAAALRDQLDAAAPAKPGELYVGAWDWGSPQQASEALRLDGCAVEDTADETLAAAGHPLAELLRKHRQAAKQCESFGEGWLKRVREDGRVYPDWKQIGGRAGRMACADPNMQQLPRGEHRRCVVAGPGRGG